jgi:hypothetical protein
LHVAGSSSHDPWCNGVAIADGCGSVVLASLQEAAIMLSASRRTATLARRVVFWESIRSSSFEKPPIYLRM